MTDDLAGLDADLARLGPLTTFPWHPQQQFALAAAADVIVVLGGTQSGKTEVGAGVMSRLVRREGPLYRRLLNSSQPLSHRAMKLWVAPQTLEKFESNWENRLLHKVFAGLEVDYVRSPFRVMRWHDAVTRARGLEPNEIWCKCLPEWEVVRMADGTSKPIRDVRVGEHVMGIDPVTRRASPARVTATTRTGIRAVERLTFRDGTTLCATPEHRVLVHRYVCGKGRLEERPVGQLGSVAGTPALVAARERVYVDPPTLALPPYLLGALLGDGSLHPKGIRLTSADVAVVERTGDDLERLGYRWSKLSAPYAYHAVEIARRTGRRPQGRLVAALDALGLLGVTTRTKFIPPAYFRASHSERLQLIAGLVDTDGTARRFTSCSPRLARDFAELVRSVGGTALLSAYTARCTNAKLPSRARPAWRVDWNIAGDVLPLALPRKRKPIARQPRDTTLRRVVAQEPIGMFPCVDIAIDHPSHLFLAGTADVAVHNSHDQGYRAFESDVVDGILWDEEPVDKRIWSSGRHRGTTVNGFNLFTFTPINGMSWTYHDFYQPTVKPAYQVADRVWKRGRSIIVIQMGMADNPTAVSGGGVQRILDDPSMTEAEKRTRLYGEYGYTEGLIFPAMAAVTTASEDVHLLDHLPDTPLSWVLAADPNKRHGAALVGLDPFGNYYLADEHYAESLPDSQHAAAYHAMLERWHLQVPDVLFGADPGGAGAQAILNMAEYDLPFQAVPKDAGSVSASIKALRQLLWVDPQHVHPLTGQLGAPRFYVLRTVRSQWVEDGVQHDECRFLYEVRQYRQKESAPPDTPIKERDDVVDPVRYVMLLRPWKPDPEDQEARERRERLKSREKLDALSRKMDDEFEQLAAEAQRRQGRRSGTDFSAR